MQQFQVHRLIIVIIGYKKEGIIHLRYAPERCCERFAPGCRPPPPLRPFLPRPEATRQPIDSDWGKFWLVVVSSFGFSFFFLRLRVWLHWMEIVIPQSGFFIWIQNVFTSLHCYFLSWLHEGETALSLVDHWLAYNQIHIKLIHASRYSPSALSLDIFYFYFR